jgi:hypothetical protein
VQELESGSFVRGNEPSVSMKRGELPWHCERLLTPLTDTVSVEFVIMKCSLESDLLFDTKCNMILALGTNIVK